VSTFGPIDAGILQKLEEKSDCSDFKHIH
jgi:hypothetical protein